LRFAAQSGLILAITEKTPMSKIQFAASCLLAVPVGFAAAPAQAREGTEDPGWDADVSLNGIAVGSSQTGADELDSSGFGARAEIGYSAKAGDADMRLEVDASVFDYSDGQLPTRKSYGARAEVKQPLGRNVTASVSARYAANLVTLESQSADQTSARGKLTWEKGKNQVSAYGEYRWRTYAGVLGSTGKGLRAGMEYRHRFGSYHWARLDLSHEKNTSSDPLRGYKRVNAAFDYSRPIARDVRLLAGIEARHWTYDGRIAQGAGPGVRRKDSLIAPDIGLSYGRTQGLYATGRASYQFRQSNDARFGKNGPRITVAIGFRF
jgi:hypothetical protein